ncbi:MAG: hypothetical protein HC817_05835 [Saprospiraceae bacterium]|nr:hypothetical protein [Saprospiraceae bacterium]
MNKKLILYPIFWAIFLPFCSAQLIRQMPDHVAGQIIVHLKPLEKIETLSPTASNQRLLFVQKPGAFPVPLIFGVFFLMKKMLKTTKTA